MHCRIKQQIPFAQCVVLLHKETLRMIPFKFFLMILHNKDESWSITQGGLLISMSSYVVKAGKREVIRRIQNLEVTKEDIWVVTYPR